MAIGNLGKFFKSIKSPSWVFHRIHEGPVRTAGTVKKEWLRKSNMYSNDKITQPEKKIYILVLMCKKW